MNKPAEPLPLPSRSAPTLAQLEKRLYRTQRQLTMTLSHDHDTIESLESDVLNAAASLVRRWEWLKTQGLWP